MSDAVMLNLHSIEVLQETETLSLSVAFLVKSRQGEIVLRFPVEGVSNLHAGVERARNELYQFAAQLQTAARIPLFETK